MTDGGPGRSPILPAALHDVLLESRTRWRDFVAMAVDIAWETGPDGCFTFVTPDTAFGWTAAQLIGRPAQSLAVASPAGIISSGLNPMSPVRNERVWFRRGDGEEACLLVSAVPLRDAIGRQVGVRGVARDITTEEQAEAALAHARRCEAVSDFIMRRVRSETSGAGMLAAFPVAMAPILGADQVAILMRADADGESEVLATTGAVPAPIAALADRCIAGRAAPATITTMEGLSVLVVLCRAPEGHLGALVLWRENAHLNWTEDDAALVGGLAITAAELLSRTAVERQLERDARTDALTGLLNRAGFMHAMQRRLKRLAAEGGRGALVYVDLDNFKSVNDRLGHAAGDAALRAAAAELQRAIRPGDLAGRLGGDEFALWLEGIEPHVAKARVAEVVRATEHLVHHSAGKDVPLSFSAGLACFDPTHPPDLDALMDRADAAMYAAKRAGKNCWRVAA
ncbi:MAG: GGDEF domain-containing protein [Alphaproteobacteria bacterium]|nr:GGDEF domain-containing protein [Alphaproteobacteria bacterium]